MKLRGSRHPAYRKPGVGADYAGDLFSPQTVLSEMRAVDGAVNALNSDIQASQVADDFKAKWQAFASEWKAFYADNQGVLSRVLNQTYALTLEYRDRVAEWRKQFMVEGGKPSTPALPKSNTSYGKGVPWLGLFIGAGALALGVWWFGRSEGAKR